MSVANIMDMDHPWSLSAALTETLFSPAFNLKYGNA